MVENLGRVIAAFLPNEPVPSVNYRVRNLGQGAFIETWNEDVLGPEPEEAALEKFAASPEYAAWTLGRTPREKALDALISDYAVKNPDVFVGIDITKAAEAVSSGIL